MRAPRRPVEDRGPAAGLGVPATLIVGGADLAAEAALERCIESDVTLCSPRGSLRGMTREHRFKLTELAFENEITIWLGTTVERIEQTEDGRVQVFLAGGGPRFAVFDDVLVCPGDVPPTTDTHSGKDCLRPATLSDGELRRAG